MDVCKRMAVALLLTLSRATVGPDSDVLGGQFFHSPDKHLMNIYNVPETVLGTKARYDVDPVCEEHSF